MDKINYKSIKEISSILRALNNGVRQKIVTLLNKNEKMLVTELSKEINLEHSVMSQHLYILRQAKIVKFIRSGKFVYFTLNNDVLLLINFSISSLSEELKNYSNAIT